MAWERGRKTGGEVASALLLSLAPGFTPKHFSLAGVVATGSCSQWVRKGDVVSAAVLGAGE